MGPTPVLSKSHVKSLEALHNISPSNSQVWTWWDWGYATDYYAKRKSFADGGKHGGSRVFPLGLALSTSNPMQSAQMMKYCAALGGDPGTAWQLSTPREVQNLVQAMGSEKLDLPPTPNQYLVVTWENFRILYWISFYGTWNFVTKSSSPFNTAPLPGGKFDLSDKGVITLSATGEKVPVQSVVVLTSKGVNRQTYPGNTGPHLIYSENRNEGLILDDRAMNSMMVQLLIRDHKDPRIAEHFSLVWDSYPEVRIYRVL